MKQAVSGAELEIMRVLWRTEDALTAQEILEQLEGKTWKYSTVATLLSRMDGKGAVRHEKRGRFFHYRPTVGEEEYRRGETQRLVRKLYDGSAKALVASLFESEALSKEDVSELKRQFGL